jgi:hypothetical protein
MQNNPNNNQVQVCFNCNKKFMKWAELFKMLVIVCRRCLNNGRIMVSGNVAKDEYMLKDNDLKQLPYVSEFPMARIHFNETYYYKLSDIKDKVIARHGSLKKAEKLSEQKSYREYDKLVRQLATSKRNKIDRKRRIDSVLNNFPYQFHKQIQDMIEYVDYINDGEESGFTDDEIFSFIDSKIFLNTYTRYSYYVYLFKDKYGKSDKTQYKKEAIAMALEDYMSAGGNSNKIPITLFEHHPNLLKPKLGNKWKTNK